MLQKAGFILDTHHTTYVCSRILFYKVVIFTGNALIIPLMELPQYSLYLLLLY